MELKLAARRPTAKQFPKFSSCWSSRVSKTKICSIQICKRRSSNQRFLLIHCICKGWMRCVGSRLGKTLSRKAKQRPMRLKLVMSFSKMVRRIKIWSKVFSNNQLLKKIIIFKNPDKEVSRRLSWQINQICKERGQVWHLTKRQDKIGPILSKFNQI